MKDFKQKKIKKYLTPAALLDSFHVQYDIHLPFPGSGGNPKNWVLFKQKKD
jgi:hypothetical protein